MSNSHVNSLLNDVLITLNRSLLQYLRECSPWTATNEAELQQTVKQLVKQQKSEVSQLTELLTARRSHVDFGLYPTEYTDLQFLSLSYLLHETLENAQKGLTFIADTESAITDDADASRLLRQTHATQQDIVNQLEKLVAVKS